MNEVLSVYAAAALALSGVVQVSLLYLLSIAVASLVAIALYFIASRIVSHTHLSDHLKKATLLVFSAPIPAAIIGFSLYEVITRYPPNLPPFFGTEQIALIIELGVLAITIRTAGAVAKLVMFHITKLKEVDRVLVYGIYGLGAVALLFILLTSPASPVVVAGIWQTVGFIAGLVITYLVVYVANMIFRRYAEAFVNREAQLRTTVTFLRRLALAVIALVGAAIATFTSFPSAGAAVASLFVAAGFTSIVVGLAAQSTLANIFAGMVVSTSQPFRIGDAVLFKNEWCWVEDIRLSFTVLKTWDNRRLVVPNQLFLSDTIVNYTLNDPSKLVIVFVQVSYDIDLDKAIEIMKDTVRKHSDFLPAGNLPVVHVMEFNESGINLRLLGNAKDQPTAFQMSKDLLYSIRKEFIANGMSISYPRREMIIKTSEETDERIPEETSESPSPLRQQPLFKSES